MSHVFLLIKILYLRPEIIFLDHSECAVIELNYRCIKKTNKHAHNIMSNRQDLNFMSASHLCDGLCCFSVKILEPSRRLPVQDKIVCFLIELEIYDQFLNCLGTVYRMMRSDDTSCRKKVQMFSLRG